MRLEGRIEIAAAPDATWALLLDPLGLAGCVPGVRGVSRVDDRTFTGSITASVGPMDGDFSFTSVITRAERPELDVVVEGTDSVTRSRLESTVHVVLEARGEDAAALVYRADLRVRGRLAILGEMVLRATATLMIGEVTRCLRAMLEAAAAGDRAPAAAPSDPVVPA